MADGEPAEIGLKELSPLESFVYKIKENNLPIDESDAKQWGDFVLKYHPPSGFLDRLTKSFQYSNEEQFTSDYRNLARQLKEKFKDPDFSMLLYDRHGSANWMNFKLALSGFPTPRYTYYTLSAPEPPIMPAPPKDPRLLIVDDFMIGGHQIEESLSYVPNDKYKITVAVVYNSPAGREKVTKNSQHPFEFLSVKELKPASDFLGEKDIDFFKKITLNKKISGLSEEENEENAALIKPEIPLFWTYYKLPDNIFAPLRGYGDIPPLIREEKFTAPYRNQGT